MENIELPTFKCLRCGGEWIPRFPQKPKVCPKCKSPYWDKKITRPTVSESRRGRKNEQKL